MMEVDFFDMELEKFYRLLLRRLENRRMSFYEIDLILNCVDSLRSLSLFLESKNVGVLEVKNEEV